MNDPSDAPEKSSATDTAQDGSRPGERRSGADPGMYVALPPYYVTAGAVAGLQRALETGNPFELADAAADLLETARRLDQLPVSER